MRELPIPAIARTATKATEVVRVWVADGAQHVSVATGIWSDPGAWGILLVDLARHLARAYAHSNGPEYSDALDRIKAGFDAEWSRSTDDGRGSLVS